jgi:hypothetical protein
MAEQPTMTDYEKWRCPACHGIYFFDEQDEVSASLTSHQLNLLHAKP